MVFNRAVIIRGNAKMFLPENKHDKVIQDKAAQKSGLEIKLKNAINSATTSLRLTRKTNGIEKMGARAVIAGAKEELLSIVKNLPMMNVHDAEKQLKAIQKKINNANIALGVRISEPGKKPESEGIR